MLNMTVVVFTWFKWSSPECCC